MPNRRIGQQTILRRRHGLVNGRRERAQHSTPAAAPNPRFQGQDRPPTIAKSRANLFDLAGGANYDGALLC